MDFAWLLLNEDESFKRKEAETSKLKHRLGCQASPAQYEQCHEQTGKALYQYDLSVTYCCTRAILVTPSVLVTPSIPVPFYRQVLQKLAWEPPSHYSSPAPLHRHEGQLQELCPATQSFPKGRKRHKQLGRGHLSWKFSQPHPPPPR